MKKELTLLFFILFLGKTLFAQLKDAECSIKLCCEQIPFEYNIEQCVKAANPSLTDSISPSTFTIAHTCGATKTYLFTYTVASTGAKGKVIVKAQITAKSFIQPPPQLICEDDSVKIASKWLKCSDAKPSIQIIVLPSSSQPSQCDTTYQFLLQCIKINPIVKPQNPILDCLNPKVILDAGSTIFLPTSTATNKGVKSYLWSANNGIILKDSTSSSITVTQAGTYTVTISYTYTLKAANGSATKTCSKVVEKQVFGIPEPLFPPKLTDLTLVHSLQNPSFFKVNSFPTSMLTYNWLVTGGSPTTFTGDSIAITWDKSAVHKVCVQSVLGVCNSPFSCLDIALKTTKSNDFLEKEPIILFSNPISERLSIVINTNKEGNLMQILTVSGQFMVKKDLHLEENRFEIDTLNWEAGTYILQVKNEQGEIVALRKLIKI